MKPVKDLLPPGLLPIYLYPRAFIAGGYAACPAKASDIDVWVMSKRLAETRDEILDHLDANQVGYDLSQAGTRTETASEAYDELPMVVVKVGHVTVRGYLPVHIMVTDAPDAQCLLSGFDISTHQVAILANGSMLMGQEWTSLAVLPIQLRETSSTTDRMAKITARYAEDRALQGVMSAR